jgi:protein SCO1/2
MIHLRLIAVALIVALSAIHVASRQAAASGPARAEGFDVASMLALKTERGEPLKRDAIRGRPFVVIFGFTACPDVCPTALLELSNLLAGLGPDADRLGAYFVTVDPERDTPEHLATYLQAFDRRIVGLTGDVFQVAAVTKAFNAYAQKVPRPDGDYAMDHTTRMFVVDGYGLLARSVPVETDEAAKIALLRRVIAQRGALSAR